MRYLACALVTLLVVSIGVWFAYTEASAFVKGVAK
jgi:hypothetical protein